MADPVNRYPLTPEGRQPSVTARNRVAALSCSRAYHKGGIVSKKDTPTQFRLSATEREFLEFKGDGSMAQGLSRIMLDAGFHEFLKMRETAYIQKFVEKVDAVAAKKGISKENAAAELLRKIA